MRGYSGGSPPTVAGYSGGPRHPGYSGGYDVNEMFFLKNLQGQGFEKRKSVRRARRAVKKYIISSQINFISYFPRRSALHCN